jgi:hypothetical protein
VDPGAGLDRCGKSRLTGIRSPDLLARSESLYRLSYPGCLKYLRLYLNCRLNWKEYIAQTKKTNRLKNKRVQLVDRKKSHLSTEKKILIFKAVIKPICSYGIELCGCACKSNSVVMQRSQSKILRAIANALRYVTNNTLHTDCNITYVTDVIHERITKHHNTLEAHPKPLLEPLLQPINTSRLKRCWPLDLQGT